VHRDRQRIVFLLAALSCALLAGACSGLSTSGENLNKPPVYMGPGCYDHKGRFEPTVRIKRECDELTWVWKTAP
jgi:hypothetical protein